MDYEPKAMISILSAAIDAFMDDSQIEEEWLEMIVGMLELIIRYVKSQE